MWMNFMVQCYTLSHGTSISIMLMDIKAITPVYDQIIPINASLFSIPDLDS